MMAQIKLLVLLMLANCCVCLGQSDFTASNAKARQICENFVKKEGIPGMSISISINDSIVFSEGFGFADITNKTPVLPGETKFRMASITKTMTAATLARLEELQLIDLGKSPHFYLDSLKRKQYDFTIEEVGGHLAGIRRVPTPEKYSCDNPYGRRDFYRIFASDDLLFEPSTMMQYSNYGYKLLGLVIEKVSGASVTQNHKRHIIDVLKLKNTVPETKEPDPSASKFYIVKNGKTVEAPCLDCTFKYAGGCYLSTTEDLVTLGNAYLYPNRILKKESITSLIKSKKLKNGRFTHYGFGFANYRDTFGNLYFGHEGGYESARSSLRIYPRHKIVIAVLVNRKVEDIDGFVAKVADACIRNLEK